MFLRPFFLALLLTSAAVAQGPEGFYKLNSLSGDGTRQWQLTADLDGIAESDFGTITLSDQMTGPGEVILKDDGTAEAKWKHQLTLTYDYQPDYYKERPWDPPGSMPICPGNVADAWEDQFYYDYVGGGYYERPFNELTVEFDTEAEGTWSGGVTMNLNCTSECNVTVKYKPEDSTQLQTETFTATLNNVSVTANASGAPGGLEFDIDMLETFVQALSDQHLTGDRHLAAEDALRDGSDRFEPDYPICQGSGGPSGEFVDKVVKAWSYEGTKFNTEPTDGDLEAKHEQYYLIDVSAPYGFYVQGDWGTADGFQEVEFRYDGQTFRTSVESGYAEDNGFDYKEGATSIEADILSDGSVAVTLDKDLIKVPVSPWAAPAGSWSSTPGVMYQRSALDWPISMTATRTLSDASILTGLWGINGSVSSTFDVSAHSEGTPQSGNLTANAQFKVAKKDLSFSLNGEHQTTLDSSGLTADGSFTTSPLSTSWRQDASLVSLVPGVGTALSFLGPLGARLSAGVGASVEATIEGTLGGTYMATPSDSNPRFTSGNLTVDAGLTAQINAVPTFARGVVNLTISGGGGAIMVINLAPNPSVASLTGYLNFMLTAKFFGYESEVDKEWFFGDPPPAPSPLPRASPTLVRSEVGRPGRYSPDPATTVPAQIQAQIAHGPTSSSDDVLIYSEPHPTLPAPASQIVIRYPDSSFGDTWSTRTTATSGTVNFAPTFHRPTTTPSTESLDNFFRGVAVWVQATGPAPADPSEFAAYMNSTELRFQYYRTGAFFGGFNPTERTLTSNTSADYGPMLVECAANTQARLFWVRGDGMDLTGSTTPLQILNRNWTTYDPSAAANDASTAWSPEVVAVSGLAHIVDWRAAAWDEQNAAIALVADMDGDLSTLDDTELYLAIETAGTWAAPVRLTTNAVLDEAPALHYKDATSLALGWRQGDTVVGTFDYATSPTPTPWFDAASQVADDWDHAQLLHRSSEDSWVALWTRDEGLAYTEQAYGLPAAGSAWPAPRYLSFGDGIVSSFTAGFTTYNDTNQLQCRYTAVTENSTPASLSTVPTASPATIHRGVLGFGPSARRTLVVETSPTRPNPQPGDDLRLFVRAESPSTLTYSWAKDGVPIPHFTGPELHLLNLSTDDEGTYTVSIYDGSTLTEQRFIVTLAATYYTWIADRIPGGGSLLGPEDDRDGDGCKNVLEYLFDTDPTDAADCASGDLTVSPFPFTGEVLFDLNQRATDVTYVIEFTQNFVSWEDVTDLFSTHPVANGREIRHLFAPFSAASINSYENYGSFPVPVETNGFYRLRITSGPTPPAP